MTKFKPEDSERLYWEERYGLKEMRRKMPYEPNEVEARMLKKTEDAMHFFIDNVEAWQESKKEALETMKANSGRLKKEK